MRGKQNLLSTVALLEALGLTLEQLITDEKVVADIKGEFFACIDCVRNQPNKIVVLKGKDRDVCFPLKMIEWIEADTCYTKFHLIDGNMYMMTGNLVAILRQLRVNGCNEFLRIHKSCAVNINYVNSKLGNTIRVWKTNLTIGRYYRQEFEKHCIFINKLG